MEDKKSKVEILHAKLHRPQISDELTQANEDLRKEINKRKQIQGELEQVKENLARAQEIAHIGSWQLDIAKNELWWSDETYRIFGVASGTPMTYEKFLAYVHPEHKTGVEEPWLAALKGKPYDIEHRIIVADKIKWVQERAEVTFDEAGNAVSAIGTVQDITERKQAEDELQKSEEQFRSLFEQSPIAIQIMNPDGCVILANSSFMKQWGYSEEARQEIYEKCNLLQDEQVRKLGVMPLVEKAFAGEAVIVPPCEYDALENLKAINSKKVEGRKRWVQSILYPVKNEGGEILNVILLMEDITERKRAEDALEENDTRLQLATAATRIGHWDWDFRTNEVYLSSEWKRQLGYENHEISNRLETWESFLHPDDRQRSTKAFEDYIAGRKADYAIEFRLRHKDGSYRWIYTRAEMQFDDTGKPCCVLGCHVDITERKQAESKLKESEQKLSGILHSISDIMSMTDKDHTIVWANEVAKKLFGPDIIGKKCFSCYQGGKQPCDSCLGRKTFEDGQVHHYETWMIDQYGNNRIFYCVSSVAAYDENDKPNLVMEVSRDITQRKQLDDELHELREELLHATRVGTMIELTAALTHELNHPLGSILNNANAAKRFLKNKKPDLDEIRKIIADIISEDRRASDVMQKLRSLLKKTGVEFAPLKINDIIEEVLKLTKSELVMKNISFSEQLEKKLPKVNGDRIQLQQVFLNLIINAIYAIKGSRVKNLHISIDKQDTESIIICVRDTGVGFDEKNKDSLFEHFYTTKKEGLGMGLSISKTIVKSHVGDIWAENNKEGGASFFITLPIHKGKPS